MRNHPTNRPFSLCAQRRSPAAPEHHGRCLALVALALISLALPSAASARRTPWAKVDGPSAQTPAAIGGYAGGCLAGAEALPERGEGFETIRRWRKRYYGHPRLIAFLRWYGAEVLRETGKAVLVGDLSQARGGLMASGHRSHQLGLDADLWFTRPKQRKRDAHFKSCVDRERDTVDPRVFGERQLALLKIAAAHPDVARIFVHWAIKHHLCASVGADRGWLRKIRPWWGHDRHFHVRLRCPEDSPDCRDQAPLPPGDGCGTETWFSAAEVAARKAAARKSPPAKRPPRKRRPPPPKRCKQVLTARPRR